MPQQRRPAVYLALHAAFTLVTSSLAYLAYRSFALHTGLLVAMAIACTANGASYYFNVRGSPPTTCVAGPGE